MCLLDGSRIHSYIIAYKCTDRLTPVNRGISSKIPIDDEKQADGIRVQRCRWWNSVHSSVWTCIFIKNIKRDETESDSCQLLSEWKKKFEIASSNCSFLLWKVSKFKSSNENCSYWNCHSHFLFHSGPN